MPLFSHTLNIFPMGIQSFIMPSTCYSPGTLCQPYTKSQKSRAMAGLLISAAVSPSSCPLYTWFHRDHSAHCSGIRGLTRLLPLRECRLWGILRFLFSPLSIKQGERWTGTICGIATWVVTGVLVFCFSPPRLLWLPMSAVPLWFSVTAWRSIVVKFR